MKQVEARQKSYLHCGGRYEGLKQCSRDPEAIPKNTWFKYEEGLRIHCCLVPTMLGATMATWQHTGTSRLCLTMLKGPYGADKQTEGEQSLPTPHCILNYQKGAFSLE